MKRQEDMKELSEQQQLIAQGDLEELNKQQPKDKVAHFQQTYLEYLRNYQKIMEHEAAIKSLIQEKTEAENIMLTAKRELELIRPWAHVTTPYLQNNLAIAREHEILARRRRGIFFSGTIEREYQAILNEARDEDIKNQRADIEAYLNEKYGNAPENAQEKDEERNLLLWLAEKTRAKDQEMRDKNRMSCIHYICAGNKISPQDDKLLEAWKDEQKDKIKLAERRLCDLGQMGGQRADLVDLNAQILRNFREHLKDRTGFSNVDLSQMPPKFHYPVLAALAAAEDVFRINGRLKGSVQEKLERLTEKLAKKLPAPAFEIEGDGKLEFKPKKYGGKNPKMEAYGLEGIRYNPNSVAEGGVDSVVGWHVTTGEKMSNEVKIGLHVVQTILHECGHQYEYGLVDSCLKALPPDFEKITGIPDIQKNLNSINRALKKQQLDNELSILQDEFEFFDAFVCREFMQYAMAITEKEFGEKPTAGLIFKPGGRATSLSLYAKTNAKDFFAELFSQVLMTDSEYLTPLGKTLRKLLNSDGKPFIEWFVRKNAKDHGKAYQEHKEYFETHNGYERCLPPSEEMAALSWAIQMKQTSNYNMAENWEQAKAMQEKLKNAKSILTRLQKRRPDISDKFRTWWQKKAELIRMSEYCSFPGGAESVIPDCYTWLDILDTLAEKDPKDFESQKACAEFLDAEIQSVEKELKKAKAQRASEPNLQAVPADMAVKIPMGFVDAAHPAPLVPVLNRSQDLAAGHPLPQYKVF